MEAKFTKIRLKPKEKSELESWLRSRKVARSLAQRAEIILLSAQGLPVAEVCQRLQLSRPTVYKWVSRFLKYGLPGLGDAPRSGQPKKLSESKIKEILRMTVESIPHEATHWSIRLMAKYAGVTYWQIRQIWLEAGLKPHRVQGFKISNDPNFAEKVVDVVGLYLNPPHNALVLSVDEKTQIQALDRTQPMLPMKQGQAERRTYDYRP